MLTGFVTDVEFSPPETRTVSMGGYGTPMRVVTGSARAKLTIEIEVGSADRAALDAIMGVRIQIQPALKLPDAFAPPANEQERLLAPASMKDEPVTSSDTW